MPALSLVVITRNEADRIGRCLDSCRFIEDRHVIDAGSTDATVTEARARGARVTRADWPGFGAQRNRGLDEASGDWVLFLDADEWLPPETAREIEAVVTDPAVAGASCPFATRWLGHELRAGRWHPGRKIRLVRRGAGRWTLDPVHERLQVSGPVRALTGVIRHDPYRNLSEHLATIDRYATAGAEALRAREVRARPWDLAVRPPAHFWKALLIDRGITDGLPGVAVAGLGAAAVWLKWARRYRT